MVILVSGDHVEHHAAKLLFYGDLGQSEFANSLEGLLVEVRAGLVEVEVSEGGKGLHVQL